MRRERGAWALGAGHGIPWVRARKSAIPFPRETLAPGIRLEGEPCCPAAVPAVTRRGAGILALSPGAQPERATTLGRRTQLLPADSWTLTAGSWSGPEPPRTPAATSTLKARPAGLAKPAGPQPTHCGSSGPGAEAAPAPGAQGSLPANPSGARPQAGAVRPGPASPGAAPSEGWPPGGVQGHREPRTAFPTSRCADSPRSLSAPRRNACPRKGGGGERREEG